ncbi:MAG: aminoacyl-tRNA deacylase [Burkholderiales bacterium]
MNIAGKLRSYMNARHARFDVVEHPRTVSCIHTARVTRIPLERLARPVVFADEAGYIMAVVPAAGHVDLAEIRRQTGRAVRMATEVEVEALFSDCEAGAVPAVGQAYGIETIVDESLLQQPELFFEAGNHLELVRMTSTDFARLMGEAVRGRFMTHH